MNNSTLRTAVELWFNDQEAAESAYGLISNWDTSGVTDMSNLFENRISFNEDISEWNISNVTNISFMFYGCKSFNQNLSNWDTSNITDNKMMFDGCVSLIQNKPTWYRKCILYYIDINDRENIV